MTIIGFYFKHHQTHVPIATTPDEKEAREVIRSLNSVIGYEPSYDIWAQRVDGCYYTRTVPEIPAGEVESRFQLLLDGRKDREPW